MGGADIDYLEAKLPGRIQIEPKDGFRSRIGRSPDRADAVVMAFHHWAEIKAARHTYDPSNWATIHY